MNIEDKPEFQVGLRKLKDNFREHLLDLMANDGNGMVEIINDDASSLVPVELGQDEHMDWIDALIGELEVWVGEQLSTKLDSFKEQVDSVLAHVKEQHRMNKAKNDTA